MKALANTYFSGAGLMDLGLERGGVEIQQSFEIDPFCCRTFLCRLVNGSEVKSRDISDRTNFMERLNLSQNACTTTEQDAVKNPNSFRLDAATDLSTNLWERILDHSITIVEAAVYLVMIYGALYMLVYRANGQTFNNGKLIWDNNTNVSLYVVLESPNIALPKQLWNVFGCLTNVPPSTNAQLSFDVGLTNRYPDAPWITWDYFMLLEWTNGIPQQQPHTNWYVLEDIMTTYSDAAGRTVSYQSQGHWFAVTNNIQAALLPIAPMPGVANNNPNFNIIHF